MPPEMILALGSRLGDLRSVSVAGNTWIAYEFISFCTSDNVFIHRYAMVTIDNLDLVNNLYKLWMIEVADDLSWRVANHFDWRAAKLVMSMRHWKSTPFFDDVVYETVD